MVSDGDAEDRLRDFEDAERSRIRPDERRHRARFDDDDRERERFVEERDRERNRVERIQDDRARGVDSRLDRIEASIAGILPGVGVIVNGRIKKVQDDIDKVRGDLDAIKEKRLKPLEDAESVNKVMRTLFISGLVAVATACVLTIVGAATGHLQKIIQFYSVPAEVPINPRPSTLRPSTPPSEPVDDEQASDGARGPQGGKPKSPNRWKGRP